jgi:glutaredoxin
LLRRDNTDAAAQAADDSWSDRYINEEEPELPTHIEIFGGNGCTYCAKAILLCNERKIPFRYYNIDDSEERFDQLIGRIGSWKTVPQIFLGPKHIGGYDDLAKYLG